MSHLENLGIAGKTALRDTLVTCTDPLATIEGFQQDNRILLPSLKPALHFLDLHDVRRFEFSSSVFEELREKVLERIDQLGKSGERRSLDKVSSLLEKSFPVIKNTAIRPIVMSALKQLGSVRREYLEQIKADQELYAVCPIEVKRQIWEDSHQLMVQEVSHILSRYTKEREGLLHSNVTLQPAFFQQSAKHRRQSEAVQELQKLIGRNVRLYELVLNFLRTLFQARASLLYCTLRAELIMVYHDNDNKEIQTIDQCYKIAWCLDACIREHYVNSKRAKELRGLLDNLSRPERIMGDIGMLLADPHASKTLARSVLRLLEQGLPSQTIPKDDEELTFLVRLMNIGAHAHTMLETRTFSEPKLDAGVVRTLLPLLAAVMVEHQALATGPSSRHPDDSHLQAVLALLKEQLKEKQLARALLLEYVLLLTGRKDSGGALSRLVPLASWCEGGTSDYFLHCWMAELLGMGELFASKDHCDMVFSGYFKPHLGGVGVWRHCTRLLRAVFIKMSGDTLKHTLNLLAPADNFPADAHASYRDLVEMVETNAPSPAVTTRRPDSPLMSLPQPSGHMVP